NTNEATAATANTLPATLRAFTLCLRWGDYGARSMPPSSSPRQVERPPSSAAPRQPDHGLGVRLRRAVPAAASRRWARATTGAAAARGHPAVARRTVLHHARVGAEHVPVQVLSARV